MNRFTKIINIASIWIMILYKHFISVFFFKWIDWLFLIWITFRIGNFSIHFTITISCLLALFLPIALPWAQAATSNIFISFFNSFFLYQLPYPFLSWFINNTWRMNYWLSLRSILWWFKIILNYFNVVISFTEDFIHELDFFLFIIIWFFVDEWWFWFGWLIITELVYLWCIWWLNYRVLRLLLLFNIFMNVFYWKWWGFFNRFGFCIFHFF